MAINAVASLEADRDALQEERDELVCRARTSAALR